MIITIPRPIDWAYYKTFTFSLKYGKSPTAVQIEMCSA